MLEAIRLKLGRHIVQDQKPLITKDLGIEEDISSFRGQPLTLSYILEKSQQDLISALKNHKVTLSWDMQIYIEQTYKKLESDLKETALTFELGKLGKGKELYLEAKKALDEANEEFMKVRETLSSKYKVLAVDLDKLDCSLNSLKSAIKFNERNSLIDFSLTHNHTVRLRLQYEMSWNCI